MSRSHPRTNAVAIALAACGVMCLSGCAGSDSAPSPGAAVGGASGSAYAPITVYAAASLTKVFDEIGAEVERQTGADIQFQYAGSSDLATQLGAGAPGDVFASADENQMTVAVDNGSVSGGTQKPFATNTLAVIVPPANPGGVTTLSDLSKPDVSTVVCAPQVPCGRATNELFDKTGITVRPVSEESKVTDVLGKVSSGQADAGLVYVTDATGAGDAVKAIGTPEARSILNRYPIAVTTHGSEDPGRKATADAFVHAVLGEKGQNTLQKAGFGAPAPAQS